MLHEPGKRLRSWLEVALRARPEMQSHLAAELARVRSAFEASESERARLTTAIREQGARLALIESECVARLEVIERLEALRVESERDRGGLLPAAREFDARKAECARLEHELECMRASWSWRLTAPMRRVAGIFVRRHGGGTDRRER